MKTVGNLKIHLTASTIAGIVLFIVIRQYVHSFTTMDDEEIAFAMTVGFLGAVYTGRFLSLLFIDGRRHVSWMTLFTISLVFLVATCFSFLFIGKAIQRQDFFHDFLFPLAFLTMSLTLGMLIKLYRTRIYTHLLEARILAANSQSELQNLQSQLSPHFLFNTLNNMYGLSITSPDKVPALLLQLSDLLRYSVYDAKEMFVPLKEELNYINNYMEFEKIRIGERLHLNTMIEPFEDVGEMIAPMLLIVFIENAFKHSKNTTSEKIYIEIMIRRWSDTILFSVKNSKGETPHERSGGLGLENVRKRLSLLYPDQYDLNIQEEDKYFMVQLQLKIKHDEKDQLPDSR
ncbi:sensor histidine kinase [Chitinophaga sancti]|uniref:GHKL domain-containing protein n=1 Tax=Chitinophaga sancti TaxID=1004 RepID=A0A1K1RAT1_9BACT|nr:histidine kinase [Chitinophaga sancti]WQD65573.1 histidine kinase [Chitinophaga sancti]WQG88804.1 histidine kinase [Chitinophaga sancti]SFW69354.1 GHKL domain-containing protein [Chitinophaga sancti]